MFTSTDRFSQLLSLIQFVQIRFILIWLTSWDIHFNFFLLNDISKWIYHSKEHFEGSLKYFCQIGHYLQNNVMTKVKLKSRTSSVWVRCFDMCTNQLLFRENFCIICFIGCCQQHAIRPKIPSMWTNQWRYAWLFIWISGKGC